MLGLAKRNQGVAKDWGEGGRGRDRERNMETMEDRDGGRRDGEERKKGREMMCVLVYVYMYTMRLLHVMYVFF